MRQTVTNMIGTLPPQFFAVTVTSVSVLCKRYVFTSCVLCLLLGFCVLKLRTMGLLGC